MRCPQCAPGRAVAIREIASHRNLTCIPDGEHLGGPEWLGSIGLNTIARLPISFTSERS
jgi:hypothetical protein